MDQAKAASAAAIIVNAGIPATIYRRFDGQWVIIVDSQVGVPVGTVNGFADAQALAGTVKKVEFV